MNNDSASLIDYKALTKFYYDAVNQCSTACIKDFKTKELSASERDCVKFCYDKQMIVFNNFTSSLSM